MPGRRDESCVRRDRPNHRPSFRFTLLPTPHTLRPLFLALLLSTLLFTGFVSAKEKPKPKPQEWQIRGIEAALEDDRPGVKSAALNKLAAYEPGTLQPLVKQDTVQKIANLLKDDKQPSDVRGRAAEALGNLGESAKPYIPDILNFIKDGKQPSDVRGRAAEALRHLGALSFHQVVPLLSPTYEEQFANQFPQVSVEQWRFYAYWFSSGNEEMKRLLKWVARPKQLPDHLAHDEGVKTLTVFQKAWDYTVSDTFVQLLRSR